MAIGIGYGKTILFGEHFVVYDCKAIGFGIDKKIKVEIKKAPKFEIEFATNEKSLKAIEVLKKLVKWENFKIDVIKSEIPIASGLGSGAAFNVAITRALSNEFGLGLTDKQICNMAFEMEKVFHGMPSGIDNTLATYGGAIVFQKRKEGNLIKRLEIGSPLHLVLANSGIRSETKAMVDKVREFKEKNEDIFSDFLKIESRIVEQAISLIKNGNHHKLGELMDTNHGLLNAIGVSHIENEKIVAIARENGAFGAKLVGAGGGGFCAALMKNRKSALNLITILEKHYQCFYNLITAN